MNTPENTLKNKQENIPEKTLGNRPENDEKGT